MVWKLTHLVLFTKTVAWCFAFRVLCSLETKIYTCKFDFQSLCNTSNLFLLENLWNWLWFDWNLFRNQNILLSPANVNVQCISAQKIINSKCLTGDSIIQLLELIDWNGPEAQFVAAQLYQSVIWSLCISMRNKKAKLR